MLLPLARYRRDMDGLVVWQRDAVVHEAGETETPIMVRSVRKSILSLLIGRAQARGEIDLRATLAELGIDDINPLTAQEKSATVEDLLMSRSGIAHVAASETEQHRRTRPVRGALRPGEAFWYNNWDFNALGTIYERATGKSVFSGFVDLAESLGLADVTERCDLLKREPVSVHPSYRVAVSARDLAVVGRLVLQEGVWEGMELVPPAWIRRSTSPLTPVADHGMGYGYMWWCGKGLGQDFVVAVGGGNFLAVVPGLELVVAQTQREATPGWAAGRANLARAITAALKD